MKTLKNRESGQSLVLLLFFVLMAMTFAVSAMLMMVIGSGSVTTLENGIIVRQAADSGVENGLLKLVRDPSYSGETYQDSGVGVEITVTGSGTKTVEVVATSGEFSRRVEVSANYANNVLSVTSWKDKF